MFRENKKKILVCTDNAARGLDLPNVRHVIQAEFALNVVQYLHRIGRSSRAGVVGRATSFYDQKSMDLVNSINSETQESGGSGSGTVNQSFSRKRGLRKKWKKSMREGAEDK